MRVEGGEITYIHNNILMQDAKAEPVLPEVGDYCTNEVLDFLKDPSRRRAENQYHLLHNTGQYVPEPSYEAIKRCSMAQDKFRIMEIRRELILQNSAEIAADGD